MNKAKLRLTLAVTYELNGTPIEALEENMNHIVRRSFGESLLTGASEAEVLQESHLVEETPLSDE